MARKPKLNAGAKFFKILFGDFTKKLAIPPLFIKTFKKNIPKEPILKTEKGKFLVSVKFDDSRYFFKSGWNKFVKDHELETGDFLVFNPVDDKTFEVDMYAPTCCLKSLKLAFHEKRSCKDWEAKVTAEQEMLSKKRGRPRKPQVSARKARGNAKRRPNVQGNTETSQRERVAEAILAIDPKHPHFDMDLKHNQKYILVIPRRFVDKTGLDSKRNTLMKDPQGRVHTVDVKVRNRQVRLSSGWSAFYKANGLATGDTCVFEFLPEKGNLIEVQIIKKKAETKSLNFWFL